MKEIIVREGKGNKVWIVQKWIKDSEFEFCGVFTSEQKAVDACYDKHCCVCPAILDKEAPRNRTFWLGLYYPHYPKMPLRG